MAGSTVTTADCTLTAEAEVVNGTALAVRYELTNLSELSLYLFNRLGQAGAASVFATDPNTANVVLSPGRVVIGKMLVPVPDDKEVERQYVPCLSRLVPGATFTESLLLPYPLVPFTWYHSRPMKHTPVPRPLYVELGYTVASLGSNDLIQPLNTPYGSCYYASWFPLAHQSVISTGPLMLEAAVLSQK